MFSCSRAKSRNFILFSLFCLSMPAFANQAAVQPIEIKQDMLCVAAACVGNFYSDLMDKVSWPNKKPKPTREQIKRFTGKLDKDWRGENRESGIAAYYDADHSSISKNEYNVFKDLVWCGNLVPTRHVYITRPNGDMLDYKLMAVLRNNQTDWMIVNIHTSFNPKLNHSDFASLDEQVKHKYARFLDNELIRVTVDPGYGSGFNMGIVGHGGMGERYLRAWFKMAETSPRCSASNAILAE